MKSNYTIWFTCLAVLFGCQNELDAPMGIGNTFMKFISSDVHNTAVTALQNTDGSFMLLVNASKSDDADMWIKLIKTDKGGNIENTYTLRGEVADTETETPQYVAYNMINFNEGYLIIGESINNGSSSILLIQVSQNGEQLKQMTITPQDIAAIKQEEPANVDISGKALFYDETKDALFLMAEINDPQSSASNFALLASLNPDDLSLLNLNTFGAGISHFTNDLFSISDDELLFGGYVTSATTAYIRIIPAGVDGSSSGTIEPSSINPAQHSFINHFSYFSKYGLLAVGETSSVTIFEDDVESDRAFAVYDRNGIMEQSDVFYIEVDDPGNAGTEASTAYTGIINKAGNIIVAGSVGNEEGERKLFLQKIDPLGNSLWITKNGEGKGKIYGGNGEQPAAVIETNDGGYFVMSTTYFGNIASLILIKTDVNGNL